MAVKITKRDLIWNYLGFGINLGTNIIILPFILKFLPSKEVGLWYSFSSIGMMAILLDFGFAPTIVRNVTYCWSGVNSLNKSGISDSGNVKPNFELLNKIIITCRIIYLIISLTALLFLLVVGKLYISYISKEIEGSMYSFAWIVYCLAIFLNLFYGYYTSLLRGVGAIFEGNKATVIARLIQIIFSIAGLLAGQGIIALSVAYLFSGFALRSISKKLFLKYEDIRSEIKKYPTRIYFNDFISIFKAIWHNAWRDGIVSLAKFLIIQSNTLLCSIYINLEATASYALSLQLLTVIGSISSLVFGTYQPLLFEARIQNDTLKLKNIFSISITAYYITFCLGVIGLVFIGFPLLYLIKAETHIEMTVFLFMSFYMFLEYNHSLFASFISTSNHLPYTKSFFVAGVATVAISFLLVKTTKLGIWGLLISQFTVQALYNNWKWPLFVMKELQTSVKDIVVYGLNQLTNLLRLYLNKTLQRRG